MPFWLLPLAVTIGAIWRSVYVAMHTKPDPAGDAANLLFGICVSLISWVIYLGTIVAICTP